MEDGNKDRERNGPDILKFIQTSSVGDTDKPSQEKGQISKMS